MEEDKTYTYTSKEAVEDGILFDLTTISKEWENGLFRYATATLLSKGYMEKDKMNIPNIVDLLNQALLILKKKSKNFTEFDHFFSGKIEFPNGEMHKIFIAQNETGKFTIMLPEDY